MKMPTIEDALEISGIEVLHPGGYELSKRIGEIADIKGKKVLDVACGRGAFACYYARNFNTHVIGVDINPKMVEASIERARKDGMEHLTEFKVADALSLPYPDSSFDAVINECAVGLTSDPQKCLNEMVRVAKLGGDIVIHESTWRKHLPENTKQELSLRLGTVPYTLDEWVSMMKKAGVSDIYNEDWSSIDKSLLKIREDRVITRLEDIYSFKEKYFSLFPKILVKYGIKGLVYLNESNKMFMPLYYNGTFGYYLVKGKKYAADNATG
ncbi:MAG: methyltransferase domain-containing protein [Candidatus Methanoperedens sp.]|nr:methyltransferase domain-containing protein [Candidatus Methanoperedens sp.]CAG0979980.1 Arsenite methyltransferase [Methanosarcinales archaeon]